MGWPPKVGERLPQASEARGVREKLARYSLNAERELGQAKARGFERIPGTTIAEIEHLAGEIESGAVDNPISEVRDNSSYGVTCEIGVSVRGLGDERVRALDYVQVPEPRLRLVAKHGH